MDATKTSNNHDKQHELASEMDSSLGAWTVVTDNSKMSSLPGDEKIEGEENKIETLKHLDIPEIGNPEHEIVDDLSDGISIISESESAGRLSPNPILRETLTELSFKYPSNEPIVQSDTIQSSMDNLFEPVLLANNSRKTRNSFSQTNKNSLIAHTNDRLPEINENSTSLPYLHSGITGLFYISAILAIVAFAAKIKYPEWELLTISSQIEPLKQRVQNLELQNNLLRAEIDILTKQVNFLNGQGQRQNKQKYEDKIKNPKNKNQKPDPNQVKEKPTIKVWPGVGNNLQDVRIPASALRNPYSCEENEEDIAGYCVKISKDSIENGQENENQNSGQFQTNDEAERLEKVLNEVKTKENFGMNFEENTFNEHKEEKKRLEHMKTYSNDESVDQKQPERDNTEGNFNYKNFKNNDFPKNRKNDNEFDFKKQRKDEKNKRNKEKIQFHDEHNKSRGVNPKHMEYNENKENISFSKKFNNENSKKYYENSNENSKKFKYDEKLKNNGRLMNSDWHEKMMKQRENSRKIKDGVGQDNWYMKRANSREEKREIDHNYSSKIHKHKKRD